MNIYTFQIYWVGKHAVYFTFLKPITKFSGCQDIGKT